MMFPHAMSVDKCFIDADARMIIHAVYLHTERQKRWTRLVQFSLGRQIESEIERQNQKQKERKKDRQIGRKIDKIRSDQIRLKDWQIDCLID